MRSMISASWISWGATPCRADEHGVQDRPLTRETKLADR